jgi:hypothetical protein
MSASLALAVYRRLVRLYPRDFRDDFGPDLLDLLAAQLRDEPTWRVVVRGLVDLALTVPTQHVEAHMDRSPTPVVTWLLGALAVAALVVGVVVGSPVVLVACAAVAIAACGLALVNARRARPVAGQASAAAHWWKPAAAGGVLLAALVAITTATGELPEAGWFVAMVAGLTAVLLLGVGLVLGIVHLAGRPARRATT